MVGRVDGSVIDHLGREVDLGDRMAGHDGEPQVVLLGHVEARENAGAGEGGGGGADLLARPAGDDDACLAREAVLELGLD